MRLAIENAELAVKLSGEEDWNSHIALAIAAAHQGDKEKAQAAAEHATRLAVGDKQQLCFEITEQIRRGEKPLWRH